MSVTAESLTPTLRKLESLNEDVQELERQLRRRRKERNDLVIQVMESGAISNRQLAKYAGLSNVYIGHLRNGRNNGN